MPESLPWSPYCHHSSFVFPQEACLIAYTLCCTKEKNEKREEAALLIALAEEFSAGNTTRDDQRAGELTAIPLRNG